MTGECGVSRCARLASKAGVCWTHYKRKIKHGSVLAHIPIRPKRDGSRQVDFAERSNWTSMWARCTNPTHPNFKYYGGRGIKVCKRWEKFENFFEDMGRRPESKPTIDRINPNGNYTPRNCRWASWREQRSNTRKNQ